VGKRGESEVGSMDGKLGGWGVVKDSDEITQIRSQKPGVRRQ